MLSLLALDFFFIPPLYALGLGVLDTIRMSVFALVAVPISSLNAAQARAEERLRQAGDRLERTMAERTRELVQANADLRDHVSRRQRAEAEFHAARAIQQKLFPDRPPRLAHFDIGGRSYPTQATGGDFFDFIPTPDGHLAIAVGDVSGHGLGAALLMASLRAYLRVLAQTHADVGQILALVNQVFLEDTRGENFATILLARLDPAKRTLTYASAGHPAGHVLGPGGEERARLETTSIPVGALPGYEFPCADPVALDPGELLVLLTDGFLEAQAPDDTPFGPERAFDTVRLYHHEPPEQIIARLHEAVTAFSQTTAQQDDMTAVVIKVRPAGG